MGSAQSIEEHRLEARRGEEDEPIIYYSSSDEDEEDDEEENDDRSGTINITLDRQDISEASIRHVMKVLNESLPTADYLQISSCKSNYMLQVQWRTSRDSHRYSRVTFAFEEGRPSLYQHAVTVLELIARQARSIQTLAITRTLSSSGLINASTFWQVFAKHAVSDMWNGTLQTIKFIDTPLPTGCTSGLLRYPTSLRTFSVCCCPDNEVIDTMAVHVLLRECPKLETLSLRNITLAGDCSDLFHGISSNCQLRSLDIPVVPASPTQEAFERTTTDADAKDGDNPIDLSSHKERLGSLNGKDKTRYDYCFIYDLKRLPHLTKLTLHRTNNRSHTTLQRKQEVAALSKIPSSSSLLVRSSPLVQGIMKALPDMAVQYFYFDQGVLDDEQMTRLITYVASTPCKLKDMTLPPRGSSLSRLLMEAAMTQRAQSSFDDTLRTHQLFKHLLAVNQYRPLFAGDGTATTIVSSSTTTATTPNPPPVEEQVVLQQTQRRTRPVRFDWSEVLQNETDLSLLYCVIREAPQMCMISGNLNK